MFQIKSNHYSMTVGEHVFLRMQLLTYSGDPVDYDLTLNYTTITLRIQRSIQDATPIVDGEMTMDPYDDQVAVYEISEDESEHFAPGMYVGQVTLGIQNGPTQNEETLRSFTFSFRVYEPLAGSPL